MRALDFSDDRLALVLKALSRDEPWERFEAALNGRLLRVYDLEARCVRLDATTASGYFIVTEEGLFQFGHSKDHRPDLPQVKIMLSTLDPLALPLSSEVVPGARADDPLYVPAITRVRQGLGRSGLLYVGDCKMAALETRSFLAAGGDFYLCPLAKTSATRDLLSEALEDVSAGRLAPAPIYRSSANGEQERIAEGFERMRTVSGTCQGEEILFTERLLMVRSFRHAKAQTEALRARLGKARDAVAALNKQGRGRKRLQTREAAQQRVASILKRYGVTDLLKVEYQEQTSSGKKCARTGSSRSVFVPSAGSRSPRRSRRRPWRKRASSSAGAFTSRTRRRRSCRSLAQCGPIGISIGSSVG